METKVKQNMKDEAATASAKRLKQAQRQIVAMA